MLCLGLLLCHMQDEVQCPFAAFSLLTIMIHYVDCVQCFLEWHVVFETIPTGHGGGQCAFAG